MDPLNDRKAPLVSVDTPIFTALNAEMIANGVDLAAIQARKGWSEDSKEEIAESFRKLAAGELKVEAPKKTATPRKKATARPLPKGNGARKAGDA